MSRHREYRLSGSDDLDELREALGELTNLLYEDGYHVDEDYYKLTILTNAPKHQVEHYLDMLLGDYALVAVDD